MASGATSLNADIARELREALDLGLASGSLASPARLAQCMEAFQDRFSPRVLRELDGEALLRLMHGRQDAAAECLCHWLEFKDDDEFASPLFGGVSGGSPLKFGLCQRQGDGAWITGAPTAPQTLALDEAVAQARLQRDQLSAGADILAAMDVADTSDEAYARLQTAMEHAAPDLHDAAWAHKYWFLNFPDRLDGCHGPRCQRFHLLKLLQMPPDGVGILDRQAGRFACAGRFVAMARGFGVPTATLGAALNRRNGRVHGYWRVAVGGDSQWETMRANLCVAIEWADEVPDLTPLLALEKSLTINQMRDGLAGRDASRPDGLHPLAGEILRFASDMQEDDMVLACDGQTVVGVGRALGPYVYEAGLALPHQRPVAWEAVRPWTFPEPEALRSNVSEFGRSAANVLELERRLQRPSTPPVMQDSPAFDPFAARLDAILQRQGQAILYGPPGTGKTYQALRAARELAARQAYGRAFDALTPPERSVVEHPATGLVRVCAFHPGYAYADFMEGLRPRAVDGGAVLEPRDGLFKRLCADADRQRDRAFFLVIDEFNRGDVPRIFGELLTVLERDKRGAPLLLPVTGTPFQVPPNVNLIGTMNTASGSIASLDAALRRRFGFIELMPDSKTLSGRFAGGLPLGPWLDALNARIRKRLKRDARNFQVGHAYLLPRPAIASFAEFARIVRDDIVPLLEEYCREDLAALREILGPALVDGEGRIRGEAFEPRQEAALYRALRFEEMEGFSLASSEHAPGLGPLAQEGASDARIAA